MLCIDSRSAAAPYTVLRIGQRGSCLWASEWLGVNKSHPAAQPYYDSRIELLAEWGVDFLKADCMMCGPCYTDEMDMYTEAVKWVK